MTLSTSSVIATWTALASLAAASNQRWSSDGFKISGWNGEVVRVAFAIDTHDREVIAWVTTSGSGISGEMIRDMMLDCDERRFDALGTPQPVQWLADAAPPNPPAQPSTSPSR